jgi:hypothetical protein
MLPPASKVALGLKRNPVSLFPLVKATPPRHPVVWQAEKLRDWSGIPKPDNPLMLVNCEFWSVRIVLPLLETREPSLLPKTTSSANAVMHVYNAKTARRAQRQTFITPPNCTAFLRGPRFLQQPLTDFRCFPSGQS